MPRRPRSPCSWPGCPELVDRAGLCPQHARQDDRDRTARQTWRRYGGDWPKIRARILRNHPLCAVCRTSPATEVDHILPLRQGGTHNPANLQPICRACHNQKTTDETHRGGRH